jgi:signal transduction histidine kinase
VLHDAFSPPITPGRACGRIWLRNCYDGQSLPPGLLLAAAVSSCNPRCQNTQPGRLRREWISSAKMTLRSHDGRVRLAVTDTGPGISPEDQPRVFERLWRGNNASSTAGSGIGLAIAAEFIRAHQGRIELASQPGSGSTFTAILPLASGQAA